jgi:pimeloyl-ACP methyl ester carboxylesterase
MTIGTDGVSSPETIVADFEQRSCRYETPCGEGSVVWHKWGDGPPLLLLHGSHGSWTHWIRNIDALARTRTVWVPDLPGYGESSAPPRADDGDSFAEALAIGLRQLAGAELPADAVGFSLGGVFGSHLAAIAPELVRRLILVGTGGLGTPHGGTMTVRLRGLEGDARLAARHANMNATMICDLRKVDDMALYLQEMNAPRARVNPAGMVLPDKLLNVLPRVLAQIDAIWGECDALHPDPAAQRAVLSRFQSDIDFRVIPNAGHWAMYEDAPAFNATLRALLGQPLRNQVI